MAKIGISLFPSPRAFLPPEEQTATNQTPPEFEVTPRFKKAGENRVPPHFGFRRLLFARLPPQWALGTCNCLIQRFFPSQIGNHCLLIALA